MKPSSPHRRYIWPSPLPIMSHLLGRRQLHIASSRNLGYFLYGVTSACEGGGQASAASGPLASRQRPSPLWHSISPLAAAWHSWRHNAFTAPLPQHCLISESRLASARSIIQIEISMAHHICQHLSSLMAATLPSRWLRRIRQKHGSQSMKPPALASMSSASPLCKAGTWPRCERRQHSSESIWRLFLTRLALCGMIFENKIIAHA